MLLAPHRKIISFLPSLIFFPFLIPLLVNQGLICHTHNSHHPAAMHLIFLEWAHCLYGCIQRCLLLFLLSPASISPYPEHLPLLHQPSASPPSLHPFSNMHMSKPVQELSKPFIIAGLAFHPDPRLHPLHPTYTFSFTFTFLWMVDLRYLNSRTLTPVQSYSTIITISEPLL